MEMCRFAHLLLRVVESNFIVGGGFAVTRTTGGAGWNKMEWLVQPSMWHGR